MNITVHQHLDLDLKFYCMSHTKFLQWIRMELGLPMATKRVFLQHLLFQLHRIKFKTHQETSGDVFIKMKTILSFIGKIAEKNIRSMFSILIEKK